jgi:outer membrane protein assembly factor BamB
MFLRIITHLILIGLFTPTLHAQDAATSVGQKAIEHRSRAYEGTPIKRLVSNAASFHIVGDKFANVSPAIYDNIAYIGTDSGIIYSITPTEIKSLCRLDNSGAIEAAPAVTKENIFAGYKNNLFAAFSRNDGKLLWKYETKGQVITTPLVHGDMVYFTTSNGFVYALKAETGIFKWRFNVLSKASSPAFENDVLFVGNDRQRMYAIDAKPGQKSGYELWHFDGEGGTPLINEPDIYASSLTGVVHSIDRTTGHGVWNFGAGHLTEGTTDFALSNSTLVFGNGTSIYSMDSRAGEGFKWKKDFSRGLAGAPIIVGDVVYAACGDGKLYALDLATGSEYSHFDLGFTPQSAPVFGKDGIIYLSEEKILFIKGE